MNDRAQNAAFEAAELAAKAIANTTKGKKITNADARALNDAAERAAGGLRVPKHMRLRNREWRFGAIAVPGDVVDHDGALWKCTYHRGVTCLYPPGEDPLARGDDYIWTRIQGGAGKPS